MLRFFQKKNTELPQLSAEELFANDSDNNNKSTKKNKKNEQELREKPPEKLNGYPIYLSNKHINQLGWDYLHNHPTPGIFNQHEHQPLAKKLEAYNESTSTEEKWRYLAETHAQLTTRGELAKAIRDLFYDGFLIRLNTFDGDFVISPKEISEQINHAIDNYYLNISKLKITELTLQVNAKEKVITTLEKTLDEKDARIKELELQLAELTKSNANSQQVEQPPSTPRRKFTG